jgi:hypothetical protein
MRRLVDVLLRRHRDQTVVCVSHADPIAALTLWAGGLEVTPQLLQKPLAPARAAITIFEYPAPDALPILSYVSPHPHDPHQHEKPADKAAEQATAAAEAAQDPAVAAGSADDPARAPVSSADAPLPSTAG